MAAMSPSHRCGPARPESSQDDVLQLCRYTWFSHGMRKRTASTVGNMAFHLKRRRGSSKIQASSRTGIAWLTKRNAGILSAAPAASRSCSQYTPARNNMAKNRSASSRQERRVPASELFTAPITDRQRRELRRLAARPDSQIDFSDAPEGRPRGAGVEVGRFYRPIKQLVSLRVDADVLAWFRGQGKKYQTHMNEVLRREMQTNARGR